MIKSKGVYNLFDEDAIIVNRLFSNRKISLFGKGDDQYLKVVFPENILNSLVNELKGKTKVEIAITENLEDNLLSELKIHKIKYYEVKKRYVTKSDLLSYIQQRNSDREEDIEFTLNEIKRGVKKDYQLHTKANELYQNFIKNTKSYVPRNYIYFYNMIIEKVGELISKINLTRNIKNDDIRLNIHREIGATVDTIKDFLNTLFEIKGFKNYKQYKFLFGRVIEIGKINNGILKKEI